MKLKNTFAIASVTALLALSSCGNCGQEIVLNPYPNKIETHCGTFNAAGAAFSIDSAIDGEGVAVITGFAERLSEASGVESVIGDKGGFDFVLVPEMDAEAYSLKVTRKGVSVKASSSAGFRYAIQTIKQLLPVEIFAQGSSEGIKWSIPCVEIEDSPRFAYRGLHLDVARHFFTKEEVMKILDIMEVYKMNRLHWHLTDDQGWRIEIKKYPRLTEFGSIRKGTMIRKEWTNIDNVPYGGFYTQDEIREVVKYAESKGITIIPEIDLPGHMVAAMASYPELGCTGGPYDVRQIWGIADEVLCVGKESTFKFLEGVLDEVVELFPSEYIHIGGDECPKRSWEKCHACQAKIRELGLKDDEHYKAEHYLQSYVTKRMEDYLAAKGRKIIGWDEILEGELSPNATVMSWRGSAGGIKASKMGHDVIMTPNSHFYLDYYQAQNSEKEPFGIGGFIPVEKVYSYEPYTEDMDDAARSHILGIQANLWTEYIATPEHLEYMCFPRAAAVCEVQWTMPENKDWQRFSDGLDKTVRIYEVMGLNYAKTIFGVSTSAEVNPDKKCVDLTLTTQGGAEIRYTLDGSEPDASSMLYTSPLEIREGCTVKAKAIRENMETGIAEVEFTENRIIGRDIVLNTKPRDKYTYNAPYLLVDGLLGSNSYATGRWAGWRGTPVDVTISMDPGMKFSSVTLNALILKGEDIFNPLDLKVFTSEDGENFAELAAADYPVESASDPDGIKDYTLTFPETSTNYIKVTAQTVKSLPDWHGRHGRRGYCFVDEIIVK